MISFRSAASFWSGMLVAVALGAAARFYFASEPLWIDELHTAWSIETGFRDVAGRAGQGNQAPLYFWISWLVCNVAGLTETSLRLPSLLFSTVAIGWAGVLVRRLTNNSAAAVTTSLLLALDHWFIFYGTDARPYALLQLLSIVQIDFFSREYTGRSANKIEPNKSNLISWPLLISTAALLATHYTSLFLLAIELSFIAACSRNLNWKRATVSLLAASSVVIFMLPAIASTYDKRTDWQTVSNVSQLFADCWTSILIYAAAPAALLAFKKFGFLSPIETMGPRTWLVLFWGIGPLLIVALLSLTGSVLIGSYRYTLVGSAAFPIIAGLAISHFSDKKWEVLVSIAIITLAMMFNPILHSLIRDPHWTEFRHEDWRSAVDLVNRKFAESERVVFLFANLVEDHRANAVPLEPAIADYLKFPVTGIYKLNKETIIVSVPTLSEIRWQSGHVDLIRENHGALLVARVDRHLLNSILEELKRKASPLELELEVMTQEGNILSVVEIELVN